MKEALRALGRKVAALAAGFYAKPTGYRLTWTAVQAGAGYAAAAWSQDPKVGFAVTLLAVVPTSVARDNLAKPPVED